MLRTITLDPPVDLAATLRPAFAGKPDPSAQIAQGEAWVAQRTPEGPATLHLAGDGAFVEAEAWGPGAGWALEHSPGLVGAADEPAAFRPEDTALARLARRHRGIRITSSGLVTEALIRAIVGQKVTGREAKGSYRRMTLAFGEPAPGPTDLTLPPDPAALAASAYTRFHPFGIERKRAEIIIRVAGRATRMEEAAGMGLDDAYTRITAMRGVGPWTAAKVGLTALGDADAVMIGDYHLKNMVAWALAGEPRGDDDRMLELLQPFRPHRGRLTRILKAAGLKAPRYGPRSPIRSIERI